jgi:hypothetical protein
MAAGSLLFANTPANATALASAGLSAGVYFERVSNADRPAQTTQLDEAPEVAVLVNSANPTSLTGTSAETFWGLRQIFGSDARYVSTVNGAGSLQNAPTDPLTDVDVIYNAGQNWPTSTNATARDRLSAFFAGGGGYIGTSQNANNFAFMVGAGLVDAITQASADAGGGIARWSNVGGASSPLTGGFPAEDFVYLPSNITYFASTPAGATIDGRYVPGASQGPTGPTPLFVAGLWRSRDSVTSTGTPEAPIVIHGTTLANGRYLGLATNPFSRGDAEREWPLIGQAALWSNLTDEA